MPDGGTKASSPEQQKPVDGTPRERALPVSANDGPNLDEGTELAQAQELEAHERKLVWVFGSPRTGSTWLYNLMSEFPELATIREPKIGSHLVPRHLAGDDGEYFEAGPRSNNPNYFFATEHARELRPLLRQLLLKGTALQARALTDGRHVEFVLLTEPNGSHASDTIISLLPNSRMIFLCRDGRDVLDSLLDALQPNSWWRQARDREPIRKESRGGGKAASARSPINKESRRGEKRAPARIRFIRDSGRNWVRNTASAQRAFDLLPPEKRLFLRYENLLLDTGSELDRIFKWLGLQVTAEQIEAAVEKHSFSNIPPEKRGPGQKARFARPGLWRETFSEEEQAEMEGIMGEQLKSLGYEVQSSPTPG